MRRLPSLPVFAALVVAVTSLAGCGSKVPPGSTGASTFVLDNVFLGRPIFDVDGLLADVVHPESLYEVDPLTGIIVAGFPKPLKAGIDLSELVAINFNQILDPITPEIPLVPRNAVVVLEFSKALDGSTLALAADAGDGGLLTANSPVQVRRKDGSVVSVRAFVDGARLVLSPITDDVPGWEPSPLVFDSQGKIIEDPTGRLRVVTDAALFPLQAADGTVLEKRDDRLATELVPLPFNPGNSLLDAILLQSDTGLVSFNGFLPDLTPPRIVRPVLIAGEITDITVGVAQGDSVVQVHDAMLVDTPSLAANAGLGEWANGLLEVTSAGGVVTRYVVMSNVANAVMPFEPIFQLEPDEVLDPAVVVGDTYTLRRTEFFEPIPPPLPLPQDLPKVTVDPVAHPRDPFDEQDDVNHDLRYFLAVLDENGVARTDVWDPSQHLFGAIPPKSSLALQFSEAMDPESFDPYETLFVTDFSVSKNEPAFRDMRIGRTRAIDNNRVLLFEPFLDNQVDPEEASFIGFGGTPSSLKMVLRTVPEQDDIDALIDNASADVLSKLENIDLKGIAGITDLGGRGLGLPPALLDQGDSVNFLLIPSSTARGPFPPAVDFEVVFQTQATADPDYGAVVHRFLGAATTATFSPPAGQIADPVQSGVEYFDFPAEVDGEGDVTRRFIYGPRIFDVGLNIPGRLTGSPSISVEHLIDDFNKPAPSQWASPNSEDFLVSLGFGAGTPMSASYGARFQHIFRAGDASPSWFDFEGVILDLVGLAWSPVPFVANSTFESFEVLVGLAATNNGRGPNTKQSNGIPNQQNSGLEEHFDCNLLDWGVSCCSTDSFSAKLTAAKDSQPPLTTVVKEGTTYTVTPGGLVTPTNALGLTSGFNQYMPYPTFNTGYDPFFGKTDVFSFPYDSRFPMIVELHIKPNQIPLTNTNVYRFSPGILSSALPRFRIWSMGQHGLAHAVPNITLGVGQGNSWRSGEGGPLLEPGGTGGGVAGLPVPPGTGPQYVTPPFGNGQPPIPVDPANKPNPLPLAQWEYILPPRQNCTPEVNFQPDQDFTSPNFPGGPPTPPPYPKPNSNPDSNWYYANGMLPFPPPDLNCFPGPAGVPPTSWYGYGTVGLVPAPVCPPTYPNYTLNPAKYGDNARYYQMWNYRKRVSIIESPAIQVASEDTGLVHYLRPLVYPPVDSVGSSAGLSLEFKAGLLLDFSVEALDSGYLQLADADFGELLSGPDDNRIYVKFRAGFGVANGQTQPPSIDAIIIPYEKVAP